MLLVALDNIKKNNQYETKLKVKQKSAYSFDLNRMEKGWEVCFSA